MAGELPAELALAIACCRWPPSEDRIEAVRRAASRPIDWDRFERVVSRHRILPLVRNGLRSAQIAIPPDAERRQAEAAAAAARTALAMAGETLRLQDAFDAAGLPLLVVKGAPLAILAYGSLGLKQSRDIDLLSAPERALDGRLLLAGLGYEMVAPSRVDDAEFLRFIEFSKEALFFHSALGIHVELHWRLIDNPCLLPGIDVHSLAQTVAIGGGGVRTLQDGELFAYLCAHGALHAWSRLKWLADLGAFLAARDQPEIERLYRGALALGAGRTPAVALSLCRDLLGLALPGGLIDELRGDRQVGRLAATALSCIAYRDGEAEFPNRSRTGIRLALSHFKLMPGRDYFWNEMRFKWTLAEDAMAIRLPRRLGLGYMLLRLPLWLWRRLRGLRRR